MRRHFLILGIVRASRFSVQRHYPILRRRKQAAEMTTQSDPVACQNSTPGIDGLATPPEKDSPGHGPSPALRALCEMAIGTPRALHLPRRQHPNRSWRFRSCSFSHGKSAKRLSLMAASPSRSWPWTETRSGSDSPLRLKFASTGKKFTASGWNLPRSKSVPKNSSVFDPGKDSVPCQSGANVPVVGW
jgi:hypothetical protein